MSINYDLFTDEIIEPSIAYFVGSTNNIAFLHSDLGHSRWNKNQVECSP